MRNAPALPASLPVLLIASVVVVSVAAWASRALRAALVLSPFLVRQKTQLHRLLTAGWVHADFAHLFVNMFTLYVFADGVLRILGPVRFLALYVSAVVAAFVPTTLLHARNPKYTSLGASGAVCAVLFAAILLEPKLRVGIPFVPILVPGYVYGLGYLAYSVVQSFRATDGVNHHAHLSGAVYGAALTYLFEPHRVETTLHRLF